MLRQATAMDIPALRSLIEQSVRGLQKDDYSSALVLFVVEVRGLQSNTL